MPQQVTQLLEILDAAGGIVGIRLEVGADGAAHLVAADRENRAVFLFRPATLQLGANGHAGGLLVRDQKGAAVFNFNAFSARFTVGTLEHLCDLILAGNMAILDSSDRQILSFNAAAAELSLGAAGQNGVLIVKDNSNQNAFHFSAFGAELSVGNRGNAGEVLVRDAENRLVFFFRSDFAELRLGDQGNAGNLIILDNESREVMRGNGENGTLFLGASGNGGTLQIRDTQGRNSFSFDTGGDSDDPFFPKRASARIGTRESPGELEIRDEEDRPTFKFTSGDARLLIGTRESPGELGIRDDQERQTLRFTSDDAKLVVGAAGKSGRFVVRDVHGEAAVVVESEAGEPGVALPGTAPSPTVGTAKVRIGGPRTHGDLTIDDSHGRAALHFNSADAAILRFGSRGREGRMIIKNSGDREVFSFESDRALIHIGSDGQERIVIDGAAGDIRFRNADLAEQFEVAGDVEASPGTVMVLGDDRRLRPSSSPYDRRVVGVVSGAGSYRPGIIMDAGLDADRHVPISLFGKVSCKADATEVPIAVGDLLTSSSTPGHAMKAVEPDRAFGAVIGKALSSLEHRVGFVEMLITLQ
jgi:hypothetical protein